MTVTTTAARHEAKSGELTVITVELGEEFLAASAELSEVSQIKLEAERREKELKRELLEAAGAEVKPDHQYLVKIGGVLRHKISYQAKTGVDAKALQEAFPEAYEATKTTSEFLVMRKA